MRITLLLTGCVNPNGMAFTKLQNKQLRKQQYQTAIKWYVENTAFDVVFVENTLSDFTNLIDDSNKERLEVLSFDGNNYDRSLGKGYGEGLIVKYALENSSIIAHSDVIIKITGRLVVSNIKEIIAKHHKEIMEKSIICDVNRKVTVAFSRIVIAPIDFWKNYFMKSINKINDTCHYEFENALATSIREAVATQSTKLCLFKLPYILEGISGTEGTPIENKSYLVIRLKYILFRMGIWASF